MEKKIFLGAFILLIHFNVFSQNLEEFLKEYGNHSEVILQEKVEYDLSVKKDKFIAERRSYRESMIVTDKGLHNDSESYITSSLQPVVEYEAYTILPDSKKNKKIKVTETSESSGKQSSVFHDDVKEKKFSYSNLEVGARKYLYYKSVINDPAFIHGQSFLRVEPAHLIELIVKCSKDIELGYVAMNDPNASILFEKKMDGDEIIYSWKKKNIKPIKFEEGSPSYLHFAPHISIYVKSYKQNGTKMPFMGTLDLLHKRYCDYLKDLNKKDDENLKKLTLDVVKDVSSEEEKVKAIYYWVKRNIKYIAFESGYEGFIPRQAALVFDRKFGDCKDMASIITDMCRYAGIENVYIAWIGTRDLPYDYKELPTFATDNHMIAVYKKNNEYIYLDATDKQSRYGFPSSFIQGKEAMINTREGKFEVARVPIIEAEKNLVARNIDLRLNGQVLDGKANIILDGYARCNLISSIGDMEIKKKMDYYRNAFQMGNNKFMLKNFNEKNLEELDVPLQVDLDFNINNYVVSVEDETYINLSLIKPLEKEAVEKGRINSLELDNLVSYNTNISLDLPVNKEVKLLPKDFSIDNDLLKFESRYNQVGNQIKVVNKFKIKKLIIHNNEFELWNNSIHELKKQYNEVVILKNKK